MRISSPQAPALPLSVVSDRQGCFNVVSSLGAVHNREVTRGVPRHKCVKYAYRYEAEVQFHFDRRYNMQAMLGRLLRALVAAPGVRTPESESLKFITN